MFSIDNPRKAMMFLLFAGVLGTLMGIALIHYLGAMPWALFTVSTVGAAMFGALWLYDDTKRR